MNDSTTSSVASDGSVIRPWTPRAQIITGALCLAFEIYLGFAFYFGKPPYDDLAQIVVALVAMALFVSGVVNLIIGTVRLARGE